MLQNKILAIIALIILTICPSCNKYDTLVNKDEVCNQKWSDYEAQLERRSDLIPNLVAVVKGSAAHEKDTLEGVVQARASATQIKLNAEDLTNPDKVEAFKKAQEGLTGALSKLMMIQEAYPTLQANGQFHDLMIQMEGTENRILVSRRDYNSSVQDYNLELRRISGKIVNPATGFEFKPRIYFSSSEASKVAPKIDFVAK